MSYKDRIANYDDSTSLERPPRQ